MNQFRPRNRNSSFANTKRKTSWLTASADWLTLKLGLEKRLSADALSKILWVGFLVVIYIYFQHNFDKLIRNTEKAEKSVAEKRAAYIFHKAKYLYASKQSEIEKKLEGRGFINKQSPIKISTQEP